MIDLLTRLSELEPERFASFTHPNGKQEWAVWDGSKHHCLDKSIEKHWQLAILQYAIQRAIGAKGYPVCLELVNYGPDAGKWLAVVFRLSLREPQHPLTEDYEASHKEAAIALLDAYVQALEAERGQVEAIATGGQS